jgi:uncharacterized membrane protein YoaK (UPF0700 family)
MVMKSIHLLTSSKRSSETNYRLGAILAFVAGAINAGGFFAVGQYTSHMSGIISGIADDLALGHVVLVLAGGSLIISFILGAATTALLINWGQRQKLHSQYALPLLLESFLLLMFGLLGTNIEKYITYGVPATVLLLCYIMGLQNAIITKISKSEIRTTHMTGMVTDLGIELGKIIFWNRSEEANRIHYVKGNPKKIRTLTTIVFMFFFGGLIGALSFKDFGFISVAPLALILTSIASLQIIRDVKKLVYR